MVESKGGHAQEGVGLVELLVSIAIGLFILAGVLQLYATTSSNAKVISGAAVIQENARFIFSRLEQDVKQAGYAGCFSLKSAYARQYFSDASDDFVVVESRFDVLVTSETAPGEENDFSQFIDGENDVEQNSLTFDSLTVRFVSAKNRHAVTSVGGNQFVAAGMADFVTGRVAAIGDCSRVTFFTIDNNPAAEGFVRVAGFRSPGKIYKAAMDNAGTGAALDSSVAYLYGGETGAVTYTVNTSAAGINAGGDCSAATPQFCSLRRNGRELIEGVSAFEVEYGWQSSDGQLFFNTANNLSTVHWYFVDRIRVSVTLNSIQRTPTNDGSELLTKSYSRTFLIQNQLPVDYSRAATGV